MRERIKKIGGELTVDTTPGKGTDIRLVIPLESD
jgi:signal transduction histidine kinase